MSCSYAAWHSGWTSSNTAIQFSLSLKKINTVGPTGLLGASEFHYIREYHLDGSNGLKIRFAKIQGTASIHFRIPKDKLILLVTTRCTNSNAT